MTNILMLILLILLFLLIIYNMKCENTRDIFNINDTTAIKGIFCIIILLVHIPLLYQNKIQDAIGSFAYVGVTFFFMVSSYGLKYGINNKKDYLKKFWKKRLSILLIPELLINILLFIINIYK